MPRQRHAGRLPAFEGEQHGFRRAETIRRALEAELYFYGRIFGFTPADALEPVAIDNLPADAARRQGTSFQIDTPSQADARVYAGPATVLSTVRRRDRQ